MMWTSGAQSGTAVRTFCKAGSGQPAAEDHSPIGKLLQGDIHMQELMVSVVLETGRLFEVC